MKTLKAVEITASLSICYSGASVQRQVVEQRLTLPDGFFWLALLILSYLFGLLWRGYDFLFVGWLSDLRLIGEAAQLLIYPRQYGTIPA